LFCGGKTTGSAQDISVAEHICNANK